MSFQHLHGLFDISQIKTVTTPSSVTLEMLGLSGRLPDTNPRTFHNAYSHEHAPGQVNHLKFSYGGFQDCFFLSLFHILS